MLKRMNVERKKSMGSMAKKPRKGRRARNRLNGPGNNRTESDWGSMVSAWNSIPGGFTSVSSKGLAFPDTLQVRLRYETTSAFTSTAGAASYVQIKGNSIYRPYVGNTDSCGGYSRMFSEYQLAEVLASRVTVRLWGGVTGQDEPFRIVVVPCDVNQYAIYSGFSNIAQLYDVAHSKQVLFSPGGVLPTITSSGTTAQILFGQSKETGIEFAAGGAGTYGAAINTDPTAVWYYLIGYQNMAGTTTTNQQAQVSVEYDVRFVRPVGSTVQVQVNRFGNELVGPQPETKDEAKAERKESQLALGADDFVLVRKTALRAAGAAASESFVTPPKGSAKGS